MALFQKSDPDLKAQADLETKLRVRRRDRDAVAEQLKTFDAKVIERREAALALVGDGDADDVKLGKIENEMRAAQDRATSLRGGLARIDAEIAGLEAEIERIIDRRCRAETSAACNVMADRIARAQA